MAKRRIKDLTTTATAADLKNGNFVPLDGADGTKKVPAELLKVPTSLDAFSDDPEHRLVTDAEKTAWDGKYTKPSTGIPKSDLAPSVQTSLGLADSALQQHQSLDGYVNNIQADSTTTFGNDTTIVVGKSGKNILTRTALSLYNYIKGKLDSVYAALNHTHRVTINGVTKTIAASGGTAVNLGTYLTGHQDISGKENTSNKVSSWSGTPNNTHYPSEKLVKDSLDGKANTDGSNVTGTWGIDISGNAATATNADKVDGKHLYVGPNYPSSYDTDTVYIIYTSN